MSGIAYGSDRVTFHIEEFRRKNFQNNFPIVKCLKTAFDKPLARRKCILSKIGELVSRS
jgi:hypothetical protein